MGLLPVLFTVFIDSLGFGLIMPLLGPLLLGSNSFVDGSFSIESRGWLYSLLIASYCLGQFFGSPILGTISDRLGRKKILSLTIVLGFLSYLAGLISVINFSIIGLFISRLLSGVASGNYAIAQSFVANASQPKDRAKTFGLLGMSWGVGFVVGPFIGGRFALNSFLGAWTGPFVIAAVLCLVNFLLVLIFLKDTATSQRKNEISFTTGFLHLKKAFNHPKLKVLFYVMFVFCFGWGFFTEFSPVFLIQKLSFSVEDIADFFAYVGFWIALSQGCLIRPLLKKFSSQFLLALGLIVFSILLTLTCFVKNSLQLFILVPFFAFFESLVYPSAASIISNLTPEDSQGEILGIYNSVQWAAIGLTPFFSGSFVVIYPFLTPIISSICMLLGFSILVWFWIKNRGNFLNETYY
ncbi:MAG: MFS transporter [Chlamydiae bacterium]|nr:MFS transporter [Chlamydiota bacterium]